MLEESLRNYIEKLSSSASTPGGGNAVGVVNSLACALMLMSLRIAVLKKDGTDEDRDTEEKLLRIQGKSLELADQDSLKFKQVMKTWKEGGEKLAAALQEAADVSLEISKQCFELIELIASQNIDRFTNIITDVAISAELANSCFKGGIMNFIINIKGIEEKAVTEQRLEYKDKIEQEFNRKYREIIQRIKNYL